MQGLTYIAEVDNTAADLIASTGPVVINAGSTVTFFPLNLTQPLSSYSIITASAVTVNAPFTLINSFPRFNVSLQYDPADVKLVFGSLNPFVATGNAGAAADCFNELLVETPSSTLLDEITSIISTQTVQQWQSSFNQMQPANLNNIAFAQENVAERIRQVYTDHLYDQRVFSCPEKGVWRLWAAPFVEHDHQRGKGDKKGYKENFVGFTAAFDYQTLKHWAITTGFSFANSRVGIEGGQASGNFNSYAASIGGIWTGGHFYTNALASYLFSNANVKRRMKFSSTFLETSISRKAHHSQQSNQVLGNFGCGYDFVIKTRPFGRIDITPFIDVDYQYLMQGGYTEEGAGDLDLHTNHKNYDLLRPEAGLRIGYRKCLCDTSFKIDTSFSYVREFRFQGAETKSRFAGGSCLFNVKGLNPENTLFAPSVRLTLGSPRASLMIGYYGEFGSHFIQNAGEAELKVAF